MTTHPPPTDPDPPAELPDLDHLAMADFRHIYEPSDDTFLLMDALEADAVALQALRPRIVVEIGYVYVCVRDGQGRSHDKEMIVAGVSPFFLMHYLVAQCLYCDMLCQPQGVRVIAEENEMRR